MADEIRQVLGFDVSQALLGLGSLQSQLDASSGAIDRLGNSAQRFNRAGQRFNRSAGSVVDGNQRMSRSSAEATGAFDRLTTSTELLSRILFTQLVIRGLRRTIDALNRATEAASELQLRIAEVSTIDVEGVLGGQAGIADAAVDISDAFGIDQIEVVRGLYQTLSNQIQGTRDDLIDFNTTAAEFARGGFIEQEDAINLLTGTIQSFGLSVSQVDQIASQFQKTIELGRTTASQLAGVLGTVQPIAAQLGVSTEELNAAFATLTINGIKTNNAATQLRGVFTALVKPSDDLKDVLRTLGFASGEAAIAALGLDGALSELISQTNGSTTEIAKLFPRVRGLSAALVLGVQDTERFTENIEKLRETASDLSRERFEIVFGTDAAQIERARTELNNALLDIGQSLVAAQRQFFDFVGGGGELVAIIRDIGIAIGVTAAIIKGPLVASLLLAAATNPFTAILTGLSLAIAGFRKYAEAVEEEGVRPLRELQEQNTRLLEEQKKRNEEELQLERDKNREVIRATAEATREIIKESQRREAELKRIEDTVVKRVTDGLDDIVTAKKAAVNAVKDAITDSNEAIIDSQNRVRDLTQSLEDREFDFSLGGLSDRRAFGVLKDEAQSVAREAAASLSSAITPEDVDEALSQFDRAFELADRAGSKASGLENSRVALRQVEDLVTSISNRQRRAEQSLQSTQQESVDSNKVLLEQEKEKLGLTETLQKTAKDALDIFTDTTASQRQRDEAAKTLDLVQNTLSGFDLDISDEALAALPDKVQAEFDGQVINARIRAVLTDLDIAEQFQSTRDAQQRDLIQNDPVLRELQQIRTERGMPELSDPEELRAFGTELIDQSQAVSERLKQFELAQTAAANSSEELATAVDLVKGEFNSILGAADQAAESLGLEESEVRQDSLPVVQEILNDIRAIPKASEEQAAQLVASIQQRIDDLDIDFVPRFAETLGPVLTGLENALEAALTARTDLQALPNARELVSTQQAVEVGERIRLASEQQSTTIVEAGKSFAAEVRNSLPQAGTERMHGGMLFRQGGGFTNRGTDTVPVMASPGEMFINARDTRRFFSELQGINAGLSPQFRDSGGPVTNVGDINVTIQGSESTETTARKLARQVNREIRRGTITNLGGKSK